MACVCDDADAGSTTDVALMDTPSDRELPPPDRTPSWEDAAEAGGETGTAVDDVVVMLDAGTPDDGPQGIDTGAEVNARQDVTDVDVVVVDDGRDVGPDIEGSYCKPEGALEQCAGRQAMRVCRLSVWTTIPCGASTSGGQEICVESVRACLGYPLGPGVRCTGDSQCASGYVACIDGGCVWGGPVGECSTYAQCQGISGVTVPLQCRDAMLYGSPHRVCAFAAPVRPCVHERACPSGWRCDYFSGICLRRTT